MQYKYAKRENIIMKFSFIGQGFNYCDIFVLYSKYT